MIYSHKYLIFFEVEMKPDKNWAYFYFYKTNFSILDLYEKSYQQEMFCWYNAELVFVIKCFYGFKTEKFAVENPDLSNFAIIAFEKL